MTDETPGGRTVDHHGQQGLGKALQLHWCCPTLLLLPHHPLLPTHSATWPVCRTLSISLSLFTRRNQCWVEEVWGRLRDQCRSPMATFDRPCCHRILNEKLAVQVHHHRRNRSDGEYWNFQVCGPSRPWVPVNCVVSHSQ